MLLGWASPQDERGAASRVVFHPPLLLRAGGDAGTMCGGDPVGSKEGVMRKENISVGSSFLPGEGYEQVGAQEVRKDAKREEGRENVQKQRRKKRCPNTQEQGSGHEQEACGSGSET